MVLECERWDARHHAGHGPKEGQSRKLRDSLSASQGSRALDHAQKHTREEKNPKFGLTAGLTEVRLRSAEKSVLAGRKPLPRRHLRPYTVRGTERQCAVWRVSPGHSSTRTWTAWAAVMARSLWTPGTRSGRRTT